MSVDVKVETRIARKRADVAAYMFDPKNDAEWTTGVVSVNPLTEGRLRAGSRVERVTKFLGKTFGYTYEVVGADDDRWVEMTVEQPFPMHIRYELEDQPDGGTLARIHASGDATGFFKLAAPLMNGMVRRNIGKDLELLKKHLET